MGQQQQQGNALISIVLGSSISNNNPPIITAVEGDEGVINYQESSPTGHPLFESPMVTSQSVLHVLYLILIIIAGLLIAWGLPKLMQWFSRDICGFEIWVTEDRIEKRLDSFQETLLTNNLQQQQHTTNVVKTTKKTTRETNDNDNHNIEDGSSIYHRRGKEGGGTSINNHKNNRGNDASRYSTIIPMLGNEHPSTSDYFKPGGGYNQQNHTFTITRANARVRHTTLHFFRANFILLFYASLQLLVIFGSILIGLWMIQYDVFAIVTSLGLLTFISIFHLGDFFRNFFAYFWILGSYQMQRGDLISVSGVGVHGCVLDFTTTHVILRCIGRVSPGYPCVGKWNEYIPNSLFFVTAFRIYDEMTHDYQSLRQQ